MNNEIGFNVEEEVLGSFQNVISKNGRHILHTPEILFLTPYPLKEGGIANYSLDLIKALNTKFSDSFSLKVCALESGDFMHDYPDEVKCTLDTNDPAGYLETARAVNDDERIEAVLVQHEFGFFQDAGEEVFLPFLYRLIKPVVVVFHTVLPRPAESLKLKVRDIAAACESVIVRTNTSAQLLREDYGVPPQKIAVVAHDTHLVQINIPSS